MSAGNSTAQAYLRTKVMTAPPEQLRLMLLDGAVKFGRQGAEGLGRKDFEAAYNGLSQCRNIVIELMTTMRPDVDSELCERMTALYTFMINELIQGSFDKDAARVEGVVKLLEYERETWAMLIEKLGIERGGTPPAAAPAEARSISVEA
jgi:flagellar secretion chaperone FliS